MNNTTQSPISALQGSLAAAASISPNFISEESIPKTVSQNSIPNRKSETLFKFTIARYDFDADVPTKRYVGFRIQNIRNGKTEYVETELPISEIDGKSEMEILDMAYSNVKDRVKELKLRTNNILGTEYIPPSED